MKKKFGMVIGNPPYQDDTNGDNKSYAPPVYNKIMEAAHKVAEQTVLITPARFLFDAGGTPKDFNRRMLNDPHFKVLDYAPDAKKYFRGVDIEGGVAVTMYDHNKNFGAIETFTPWQELRDACEKIITRSDFRPLSEIIYSRKIFKLTEKFYEENPDAPTYLKDSNSCTIGTNAFEVMRDYFFDSKPDDGNEYVQIFGLVKMQRVYRWIRRDYVNEPAPLEKFKVFLPKANGASGKLNDKEPARLISKPVIGEPFVGSTETFIAVGAFDTRAEVEACLTYVKSKFARALLGILKITQDNTADKWAKVPLEDFTAGSDIDWHGDIDEQLYDKYGLDAEERAFIERHVKAMD